MRKFAAGGARALALAVALGVVAVLAVVGGGAPAGALDNPFDHIVPLVVVGQPLPDTAFVDQTGRHLRMADLAGNAVAVAFVYTRCRDECPIITRKLGAVRALIGAGSYRLVEVTIDPGHDTPRVMQTYAREYRMDAPTWLGLTGAPSAVDDFNRRMGVQAIQSGRDEIIHNDRLVLVSTDGRVADIIDGASWTPADVTAQLRHLSGMHASLLDRLDLALGAAVAYCGGALAGRAGIGDLLASITVIAAAIALFVWLVRRSSAARA